MELDSQKPFAENLNQITASTLSAFRHQKFNYGDALSAIRQESGFTERLYDVTISYQNAAIAGNDGGVETTWYHCGMQTESLQIHIDDRDTEGVFRIHFDYQTEKFTEQEIEKMYGHVLNLLFDAIENDSKKLYEFELLSKEEKQQILHDFNATAADYPKDKCVHQLFEEQAERTPNKTAVIACDATLTYRELNQQANRIAHSLIAQGVRRGDIVAFALPRRSYLLAAMFGILKVGAAYLPIDPEYPQERIDYMLEDSKAAFFITEENIADLLECENTSNPNVAMSSSDLCYCIYTSGSTGQPKGTLLKHRGIANFCQPNFQNNLQQFIYDNCSNVLACGSIAFDISYFEITLSLLLNKTVVLADETLLFDGASLGKLITRYDIDCIHCTPTKLSSYFETFEFAKAFSSVR